MIRCINLRPHEALAAAQGRLTVLVRPMKPQPWIEQCCSGNGIDVPRFVAAKQLRVLHRLDAGTWCWIARIGRAG